MGLEYPAWFVEDDETGKITVQLFDMPGCVANAYDIDDAIDVTISRLRGGFLHSRYYEPGKPVPMPSNAEEMEPSIDDFEGSVLIGWVELPEEMSRNILAHNKRCLS